MVLMDDNRSVVINAPTGLVKLQLKGRGMDQTEMEQVGERIYVDTGNLCWHFGNMDMDVQSQEIKSDSAKSNLPVFKL